MGDLKSNDNILYFKRLCLLLNLFFNHLSRYSNFFNKKRKHCLITEAAFSPYQNETTTS